MRKIVTYIVLAALCLTACGKHSENTIDYMPCQTELGQGWGLIDNKGQVILAGKFDNEPSPVSEGMMTVKNGSYYQLYKISDGEAVLVADSLASAGIPAYGRVPVCRANGSLEVLDKNGETVFVFEPIESQHVVSTAPQYERGLLQVETVNSLGMHHLALVDRNGKTVLPPHYSDILVLEDDLAWVMQETVDNSDNDSTSTVRRTSYFVDMKGHLQADKPRSLDSREKVLAQYAPKQTQASQNGWMVDYIEGFGYIGSKDLTMAVLDSETWTPLGQTVSRIGGLTPMTDHIANDTYTYDKLADMVLAQLQEGLQGRGLTIPLTAPYITSILDKPANDYNSYLTIMTYAWQEGDVRCEAKAVFDTTIVRKRMVIQSQGIENQYGEAVQMNKLVEDGYEYNPDADLMSIDLDCMIDSTRTQIVYERVLEQMAKAYKQREKHYLDREQLISVEKTKGRIHFHIIRDPQVIAAEEEARKKAMQAAIDSAINAQTDTTVQAVVKNDTIIAQ